MPELLLGIDIGATGIKVGAFDLAGRLVASASRPNGPRPQPEGEPGWLIWDADEIWQKVCAGCREVVAATEGSAIRGVATTGFGADGVPLDANGERLYPFISWHDSRTAAQSEWLESRIAPERIYQITGYHNYPINTLNRLAWYRQCRPDVLEQTARWLQMQDYIAFRLSGEYATDVTIASTMMSLDLATRQWSGEMLEAGGIDPAIFAPLREAGAQIGAVTDSAAEETGLPLGAPVVTGGHDCEIATLGSGVNDPGTFLDITGTWEIILAVLSEFAPTEETRAAGLDFECHAVPGQYICQGLMIAGGVTEWVRERFYTEAAGEEVYARMMADAAQCPIGAEGVLMLPSFVRGMGPAQRFEARGSLLGLTTVTSPGQVVRATLESLCYQLRQQTEALERHAGRVCERLRVVSGGARNPLWLQMKADVTGKTVEAPEVPEVTLLGVAILAGVGAGVYADVDEALGAIDVPLARFEPDAASHRRYSELYEQAYQQVAPGLERTYRALDDLGL